MLLLPVLYLLVFNYWPMYGVQIAFRNFNVVDGITGSPLGRVGALRALRELLQLLADHQEHRSCSAPTAWPPGSPIPIILALGLNYVGRAWFRRTVQMVGYAPFFISTVVMVGIILLMLDPRFGPVNQLLGLIGFGPVDFMGNAAYFRQIYVWSGVWQYAGFSCIIYLAALTSVDPTLHEAAIIDGANKLQRIRDIDLPTILPVAVVLLILEMGAVLSLGFEKILLLQNPINLPRLRSHRYLRLSRRADGAVTAVLLRGGHRALPIGDRADSHRRGQSARATHRGGCTLVSIPA